MLHFTAGTGIVQACASSNDLVIIIIKIIKSVMGEDNRGCWADTFTMRERHRGEQIQKRQSLNSFSACVRGESGWDAGTALRRISQGRVAQIRCWLLLGP
jgi:hypothetical protein